MSIVTTTPTPASSIPVDSWLNLECTRIDRRENDWVFEFGDGHNIMAECPWRIVAEGRIAHADEDDGQLFGLERPVVGSERAKALLAGKRILGFKIAEVSGDLRVEFTSGTILEFWNNSSGYESWRAIVKDGAQETGIVSQGGGRIAIWRQ
jgi:hypothetical protein